LWAWGNNSAGQVGDGTFNTRLSPAQIGITTGWFIVNTGNSFSMALKADGTLWSWGYNFYGQIGNGNTNNQTSPVQIGTETDWYTTFDGGFSHTVALKSNGSLRVWGSNNSAGLLGNSSNNQLNSPITINCPASLENEAFTKSTHTIFPNPASTILFITTNESISIDEISIYDGFGKEIIKKNNCNNTINIEQLKNGIYFIRFRIGDTVSTQKLIKN
jgi:alpha-tubulin suppressor-like RCC1 family protein